MYRKEIIRFSMLKYLYFSVFPNSLYDNVGTHEDDYEDDLKTPTIENVLSLNEVRHYWRTDINEVFEVKQIILVLRLDWKLIIAQHSSWSGAVRNLKNPFCMAITK